MLTTNNYFLWPTEMLVKYVVKAHHRELCQMLDEIKEHFREILSTEEPSSPELIEAHLLFFDCAREFEAHLSREAIAVLPFVKRYTEALKQQRKRRRPGVNSACPAISKMYQEHNAETLCLDKLLEQMESIFLLNKESPPFEILYKKMYAFKSLWQEQVQLENDILFPKIIEMEAALYPLSK